MFMGVCGFGLVAGGVGSVVWSDGWPHIIPMKPCGPNPNRVMGHVNYVQMCMCFQY